MHVGNEYFCEYYQDKKTELGVHCAYIDDNFCVSLNCLKIHIITSADDIIFPFSPRVCGVRYEAGNGRGYPYS